VPDELLQYYERELVFLRRMGAEFARRYPKIAGQLQLEPTKSDDPHVERMLEAFALLSARVHMKLDEDFPEISESLLNIIYPHYVRPMPPMSIAQLRLDPEQGKLAKGLRIPRGTTLQSRPVDAPPMHGASFRFRTSYDVHAWPVEVSSAQWTTPDRLANPVRAAGAVAAVRVELRCFGDLTFEQLAANSLRFFLHGDANLVFTLYELLCNSCQEVLLRPTAGGAASREPIALGPGAVRPVGFEPDEGMLPYPQRSFLGYRLLQEYFAFPEKFLFVDVGGLDAARAAQLRGPLELVFLIAPFERPERRLLLESGVSADTFRLGCTPIVNLFTQTSEPIRLTQRRHEYQVVPDARRRDAVEVFAIEEVQGVSLDAREALSFAPLYAARHRDRLGRASTDRLYWTSKRRQRASESQVGTDVFLTFVDRAGHFAHPELDAATVKLLCFNGDLPQRSTLGEGSTESTGRAGRLRSEFEMEGGGPAIRDIVALRKPTRVIPAPLGGPQLWRLVSQLSLNYLSLADEGGDALREMLRVYDFTESPATRKQIEGVLGVRSEATFTRVVSEQGLSFARGRLVELELDEEQFTGGGAYLFASVMERYLALYASLNSFTSLVARTRQRKRELARWAPRAGSKPLV
jgi:type VI secretion system protein ImpG